MRPTKSSNCDITANAWLIGDSAWLTMASLRPHDKNGEQVGDRIKEIVQAMGARYRPIAIRPWFSGVTAIVGTVAAVLAAVFVDQLQRAFPFWCCSLHFEPKAFFVWLFILLFGLMFGSNFWAQTATTDQQLNELKASTAQLGESSAELTKLIKTLPPKNFLDGFEHHLIDCYAMAVKGTEANASPKAVKEGIVSVLSSLAHTAMLFDGLSKPWGYCANVMVFRPFAGVEESVRLDYERRAKFSERPGVGGDGWSGVLELMPELAVSIRHDGPSYRPQLPHFVLEIPLPQYRLGGDGKSTVLPGAPEAFCVRGSAFWLDTFDMGNECREKRGMRPAVGESMDEYFKRGEGRDVRSFVSMALLPPLLLDEENPASVEPLGVVNIHSDKPGMLRTHGVDLFVPLTIPHKLLLSRLLTRFLKL
jgi:hypothetical protein